VTHRKTYLMAALVAVAMVFACPPDSAAKSNSHSGHNQNAQNHPPSNHPSNHGSADPAHPGMPGTGGNPGLGSPPTGGPKPGGGPDTGGGPQVGTIGPTVGLHSGPGNPTPTLPLGPGKVSKPHGMQTPQPVLPPQKTPQITQQTPSLPLGPGKVPKPHGMQTPQPVLPPQQTPTITQLTPTAPLGPGKLSKQKGNQTPKPVLPPQQTPQLTQITPTAPRGPGKVSKPHGVQTPQPVLPPQQQTPQVAQGTTTKVPEPGKKSKQPGNQTTSSSLGSSASKLGSAPRGLPGVAAPHHVGHAQIFQHAHATQSGATTDQYTSSPATVSSDTAATVFLPPQVTHGVITPQGGSVSATATAQQPAISSFCLLPTARPDGKIFGGLLEPPPGWQPAQQATTAHVSLQGGANYMDPVLRALPVNHPPHSICLCDLVVRINSRWQRQ
jgi:hypothetical protein